MERNPNNVGIKDYFYRRFYKNNVTGRISDKIYDLTDIDKLTVNRQYVFHHYHFEERHGPTGNTLFKEFSAMPYEEVLPPYWRELMKVKPKTIKVDFDGFISRFKEAMMSFVDRNWDSNKFHLVLHSSGWDSRILSYFLREVYENRGKEDFGGFMFVCWGDEGLVFKQIMERKGWDKRNYLTLPHHDDAFYSYSFNFEKVYKYLNGPTSYPLNEIYWALDILRDNEQIPRDDDKIEMWFASHQNRVFHEIVGKRRNVIKEYLDKNYYDITANYFAAMPCKIIIPILGFEPMKCLIESDLEIPRRMRAKMAKELNPELKGLPRIRIPTGQEIPGKYLAQIEKDYRSSWYGINVDPDIAVCPYVRHNTFWFRWAAASITEFFISKGINVE